MTFRPRARRWRRVAATIAERYGGAELTLGILAQRGAAMSASTRFGDVKSAEPTVRVLPKVRMPMPPSRLASHRTLRSLRSRLLVDIDDIISRCQLEGWGDIIARCRQSIFQVHDI